MNYVVFINLIEDASRKCIFINILSFGRREMVLFRLRKRHVATIIGIALGALVILAIILLERRGNLNMAGVKSLVASAGAFGPVVLVIVTVFGILFSPIPSVVFIVIAGYFYGAWWGALYGYMGHLFAALLAYGAAKHFRSLFGIGKKYTRYQAFIEKNPHILFLLYVFPIVPVSVVSVLCASSELRFRRFLFIILASFLPPAIIFSFFGNRISYHSIIEIGIWVLVLVIGFAVAMWLIRKKEDAVVEKGE